MGNSSSTPNSTTPVSRSTVNSPRFEETASQRRKKSLDLSNVDNHLKSPKLNSGRKQSMKVTELEEGEEDVVDTGGTLRGAMQGRAEHVVYGPRRIDGIAPGTPIGTSRAGSPILDKNHVSQSSAQHSFTHSSRPNSISSPASIFPKATALPQRPVRVMDPDDTTHPDYKSAPRLTSSVVNSSEKMPVIHSPVFEFRPELHKCTLAEGVMIPDTEIFTPTIENGIPIVNGVLSSGDTVFSSPPIQPPSETIFTTKLSTSPENPLSKTPSSASLPRIGVISPSTISPALSSSYLNSAVDLGAGVEGVPTLIKWTNEDGQSDGNGKESIGPKEVFVTGTFAKGWKTKIELRKTTGNDFSALISLPPGPHRLKFIVDKEWKASKHLPAATDADGNLINYVNVVSKASVQNQAAITQLQGSPSTMPPPIWTNSIPESDDDLSSEADDHEWTSEIPSRLLRWGSFENLREIYEIAVENSTPLPPLPIAPSWSSIPPPSLPAQLEKGPLNHAAYVTQGSGDDNSILPKPDHSVINHLAASPIKGGFLSVGVTTRYKRKFVTIVYYKALST